MMEQNRKELDSAIDLAKFEFEQFGEIEVPIGLIRAKFDDEYKRTRIDAKGVILKDGKVEPVHMPKYVFIDLVKQMARESQADLVMIVMEAWLAEVRADTVEHAVEERAKYGQVEDMPNRVEVVLIYLEDKESSELWRANILRSDGAAKLTDFVKSDYQGMAGGFTNLLPDRQPEELN